MRCFRHFVLHSLSKHRENLGLRSGSALRSQNSEVLLMLNCYLVDKRTLIPAIEQAGSSATIVSITPLESRGSRHFADSINTSLQEMAMLPNFTAHDFYSNVENRMRNVSQNDEEEPSQFYFPMIFSDRNITLTPFEHPGGPLGPLPQSWEKIADHDDCLGRQYYRDNNTGLNYWTRPMCSVVPRGPGSNWDQERYVASLAANIGRNLAEISVPLASGGKGGAVSHWATGFASFAEWVA